MRFVPATLLAASLALAGSGQGPVAEGPITIDDLDLGTHWYGPQIDVNDLKGKVVLVELWGS